MERVWKTGKWGGATGVKEELVARSTESVADRGGENDEVNAAVKVATVPADVEELVSPETHVLDRVSANKNIIDLYEVGHRTVTREVCEDKSTEIPFAHQLKIHGPRGEIVRVSALFDGAAMVAAMYF